MAFIDYDANGTPLSGSTTFASVFSYLKTKLNNILTTQGANAIPQADANGAISVAATIKNPGAAQVAEEIVMAASATAPPVRVRASDLSTAFQVNADKSVAIGAGITAASLATSGSVAATGGFTGPGAAITGLTFEQLGNLAVTANGTLNVTVAPGTNVNLFGNPHRSVVGQTLAVAGSAATGSRWVAVGVDANLAPAAYYGSYNLGPETIVVPVGSTILRLAFQRASCTAIFATDTGVQGFLSDRPVNGLVPAGGSGVGADASLQYVAWGTPPGALPNSRSFATVLSGGSTDGSMLGNIKATAAQGSLLDSWGFHPQADLIARLQPNGANGVVLWAGTNTGTNIDTPFSMALNGKRLTNTAPITATASGTAGMRYAALDFSGTSSIAFALSGGVLPGPGWTQTATQVKVAQFWWDGASLFPVNFQGVYFDQGPMFKTYLHQVMVSFNNFPNGANDTLAANLSAFVIAPNHPAQTFTLPGNFAVKVSSHARGIVTATATGSDYAQGKVLFDGSIQGGDLLIQAPSTLTTVGASYYAQATDVQLVTNLGPGQHTVGLYWENSSSVTLSTRNILLEYMALP
jgi:hypothetical protein